MDRRAEQFTDDTRQQDRHDQLQEDGGGGDREGHDAEAARIDQQLREEDQAEDRPDTEQRCPKQTEDQATRRDTEESEISGRYRRIARADEHGRAEPADRPEGELHREEIGGIDRVSPADGGEDDDEHGTDERP
ncbi:MAG TPA: hypothetical protein VIL85_24715 [Thermomicrobiales bacterium]